MLTQLESTYGVPGCCAATIWEGYPEENDFHRYGLSRASLVIMDEKDFKKFDSFGGVLPNPIKMDGIYLLSISSFDAAKIKNKKIYQKHMELQTRDGRKNDEFKVGDDVCFIDGSYNKYKPFIKSVSNGRGSIFFRNYGSAVEYAMFSSYQLDGYVLRTEW